MTRVATTPWSQLLRERRLGLGLTQQQVASAAGLTQQAVSYIERGVGIPRVTTMIRLTRALGTSLERLFPPEDESAPSGAARPSRT